MSFIFSFYISNRHLFNYILNKLNTSGTDRPATTINKSINHNQLTNSDNNNSNAHHPKATFNLKICVLWQQFPAVKDIIIISVIFLVKHGLILMKTFLKENGNIKI